MSSKVKITDGPWLIYTDNTMTDCLTWARNAKDTVQNLKKEKAMGSYNVHVHVSI